MEKWYFLDSGAKSPYYNMALDEKLMEWHRNNEIPPIVRFYEWAEPTLSIGYFQKLMKEINIEALEELNIALVRRPTGGRGVLHDDELTYSVIVSEKHPKMPHSVTEAYRVISEGLLEGFRNLHLDAYFSIPRTEKERVTLKQPRSAVCFDAPSWYELVVEGRKIAGSAQTRQNGVILQHGSILRSLDVDKLFRLFTYPNERIRERMKREFKKKAVAINDLMEKNVMIHEMKKAFYKGFEKGLSIHLQPFSLSKKQEMEVISLAEKKYGTKGWNFKF